MIKGTELKFDTPPSGDLIIPDPKYKIGDIVIMSSVEGCISPCQCTIQRAKLTDGEWQYWFSETSGYHKESIIKKSL